MTCPNIGNELDNELSEYLRLSMRPKFKSSADEYLEKFKENMQRYMDNIYHKINHRKKKNPTELDHLVRSTRKGNIFLECDLIIKIAKKILHIDASSSH
jgi:hypothetical protein